LKDREAEISVYRTVVIDMQANGVLYIPVKNDVIDKRLAEFINNSSYKAKLASMFVRENGEGIYQFGTRKVFIRVEQDQIIIRVGGGFLHIEEFLAQYMTVEYEKQERRDPMKKRRESLL
jgi:hypothetical protein